MSEINEDFVMLIVNWGSGCNECSRNDTTLLFVKSDKETDEALKKIARNCAAPSISFEDECDQETTIFVYKLFDKLDCDAVKHKILVPNEKQRECILAAAKAPNGHGRSWTEHHSYGRGPIQKEFTDFVQQILG